MIHESECPKTAPDWPRQPRELGDDTVEAETTRYRTVAVRVIQHLDLNEYIIIYQY